MKIYLKIYKPLWNTIFTTGILFFMLFLIPFDYYKNVKSYCKIAYRIVDKNEEFMRKGE